VGEPHRAAGNFSSVGARHVSARQPLSGVAPVGSAARHHLQGRGKGPAAARQAWGEEGEGKELDSRHSAGGGLLSE